METLGWLLIAGLAGVLLNFTPCVLPAVPIKLRLLLAEGGRTPARRAATAAALLTGSLTFFLTLGVLSAALQWSWGAPMGSVVFRAILAAALFLAALALMFDLGRFPIPQRIAQWHGSGPIEGFFVGISGGVLSLPCTGPFLGGVLAFSLTQSPGTIVAMFAAIGTGMALPYLILLAVPRLAPRAGLSGHVGRTVSRLLGLGMLAGALFYGQEFLPAWLSGIGLAWLMLAALLLWALAAWIFRQPKVERVTAVAAVMLAGAVAWVIPLASDDSAASLDWLPLEPAQASPGQVPGPALVEFTADWCINCKVLERTVYRDPEVARATGQQTLAYQVDLTDFDVNAQALLQSWDGTGLPFAVVLDSKGEVERRLRDLFPTKDLVAALEAVAEDTD